MPEYLAPGVFVEEVSYRSKSIEGVGTTTTGFVGPTRYGPVDLPLEVVTSLVEFERTYGDRQRLEHDGETGPEHNYMWHAARAFFENGGRRLYVQRVFRGLEPPDGGGVANEAGLAYDGRSFAVIPAGAAADRQIAFHARFPGDSGRRRVSVAIVQGPNVLVAPARGATVPRVNGLQDKDIVWLAEPVLSPPNPGDSPVKHGAYYRAALAPDPATAEPAWSFVSADGTTTKALTALAASRDLDRSAEVHVVTLTVTVYPADPDGETQVWSGLPLAPGHERQNVPDSLFDVFAEVPENRSAARTLPIVVDFPAETTKLTGGLEVLAALQAAGGSETDPVSLRLEGGNDGRRPTFDEYEGAVDPDTNAKSGLKAFEDIDEIAIVAAPGSTAGFESGRQDDAMTIAELLIAHCEAMQYRIAVLDSGNAQSLSQVRAMRAQIDSSHAALYYPWVEILDPVTQREIPLPPSGFVAGIYARNDVERAVYKAPANEPVTLALGFETTINKAQQETLNPEGINCFRYFEGRGYRLWGARTASSDPEWKYVNLRRYFAYLEHSIDKGTQWVVFEPNGEKLWAKLRRSVVEFLFNEYQAGALLGDKPESAFFVKCDRTTMTQNDLDNGRLVCLIGVAPLRPAEFVIFRIGQWTADAKN